MPNISTIFSIVNIVLTALVIIVVFFRTRGGMKRGAYRQPVHLASVLIASIIAFLVITIGCRILLNSFEGKEVSDIIGMLKNDFGITLEGEFVDTVSSFDAEFIAYLLVIPLALLSPLLFFLVYIVVSIFIGSARAAVIKFCKIPRRVDTTGKTIGGVLGAVEGVLFMAIMLLPLTAMLRLGVPYIQKVEVSDETVNKVLDGVEDVYEAPVIQLVSFAGGDFLANELSTVSVGDSKVNLSNELSVGFDLAYQIIDFMNDDNSEITPQKEKAIHDAVQLLHRSDYLPILLSGAMNIVAESLNDFAPDTADDPDMKALVDKLVLELGDFLRESTPETVVNDIETFVELFLLLDSNDIFDIISNDSENAFATFTEKDENGKTIISKIIATLSSNERTKPIISTLNEVSLSLMLKGMGVEGDTAEVYEELKGGINNILAVKPDDKPEEVYKEELKDTLTTTINDTLDKLVEKPEYAENIEKIEEIKESLTDEVMTDVTDKVAEFLDQNPDIRDLEEADDATILEFVTSNFGDIFKEGGFSGFGGGDSQQGDSQQGDSQQGDSQQGDSQQGDSQQGDNDMSHIVGD